MAEYNMLVCKEMFALSCDSQIYLIMPAVPCVKLPTRLRLSSART